MKTHFTPGPWSVSRKLKTYVDAGANGDGLTCIATVDDIKELPRAEAEANARLIAAAPTMFNALACAPLCNGTDAEIVAKLRRWLNGAAKEALTTAVHS